MMIMWVIGEQNDRLWLTDYNIKPYTCTSMVLPFKEDVLILVSNRYTHAHTKKTKTSKSKNKTRKHTPKCERDSQ